MSGDREGCWTCPVCGSLGGPATTECVGYIDIPDPELGETEFVDATHPPVTRPSPAEAA